MAFVYCTYSTYSIYSAGGAGQPIAVNGPCQAVPTFGALPIQGSCQHTLLPPGRTCMACPTSTAPSPNLVNASQDFRGSNRGAQTSAGARNERQQPPEIGPPGPLLHMEQMAGAAINAMTHSFLPSPPQLYQYSTTIRLVVARHMPIDPPLGASQSLDTDRC